MKAKSVLNTSKLILALGISIVSTSASALTLADYLEQVKTDNTSYKGSSQQSEGAALKSREADLFFTPKMFAEAQVGHDGKPSQPKTSDKIKSENYSLGLTQQFNFGLQSKLYYNLAKTEFVNANTNMISMPEYWDATPKLELSMPLWGGGFGRTAQANQEITRQQNYADQFQSSYQSVGYLAQAEAAYWKLSAWNDVVVIQENALKAAQNIFDYVSKKKKMNLGEEADVVQARALVEARTLELQVANNEKKEALRNFNKYLNRNADVTVDSLEPVNYAALENLTVPQVRPGDRYDVKATEAQLATAKANSQLVNERNKPTFDVYGTYALNGRDKEQSDAMKKAGYTETDTSFVGVRFNMPLNFTATSDVKSGALKTEKAAEYNRQYALYAQEQDWINLTKSLGDARDNLRLLGRIETLQKTKLDVERSRLRQGRTTTYQVLLFEQDYSQAALSKVKSAANILGLQTQIKLYNAAGSQSDAGLHSDAVGVEGK
ncbi:TolC family protein [Bdellovibrio svalbardensis]|uniref:TolC family protein n=1 Tax=Bdellovibrio svalbardensis TaxID=2972972 RepID=A0ABT6DFL4_9BACT|nr:TolC family protein [Bdellovibrio svalbardensis]MDG0815633.1 TolC family protein [Bdellovibrio svalbardensis]